MEMPTAPANNYDAMAGEISTRRRAISNAQSAAVELEQYRTPNPIPTAQSKLEKYRATSTAFSSYNRSTTDILDPTRQATQQTTSKLQRPQHYLSGSPGANGGEVDHGADENRDEAFARLNKALRIKNAKIEEQAAELVRYKGLLDDVHVAVDDISSDTLATDKRIAELLDDLTMEQKAHNDARLRLEEKTREVEQSAFRLAELEQISNAQHQENLRLAEQIREMNGVAHMQEERLQQALAAAEAAVVAPAPEVSGAGRDVGSGAVGSSDGGGEGSAQKELEMLKKMLEMKTHRLAAVEEREEKARTELLVYKGQARSGRFKRFLLNLWGLLRFIGWGGFLLFVYVAVSEDALRPRGIDVYRYTT